MNQLFRGAARSGCHLGRAGGATGAAAAAPNWLPRQASPGCRRFRGAPDRTWRRGPAPERPFSSASPDALLRRGDAGDADDAVDAPPPPPRPPSALERARLKEVLPGRALHVLHKHAAKGLAQIRQSDFVMLCDSSRPGKPTDARVIATALREFKTNNRFVLQTEGARAAVDGMLRSMVPAWKVQDGRPRVRAAVFVAEQILDERSGLYFAVETVAVDRVLEELRAGLVEMEEHGFAVKVEPAGEEGEDAPSAEESAEGEEDASAEGEEEEGEAAPTTEAASAEPSLAQEALRVTEGVTQLLIKRKTRPERDLKKRAKRRYLKLLQVGSGPYHSTLSLAAQIAVLVGRGDRAEEQILSPYAAAWWSRKEGHALLLAQVRGTLTEAAALEAAALEAAALEAAALEATALEAAALEAAAGEEAAEAAAGEEGDAGAAPVEDDAGADAGTEEEDAIEQDGEGTADRKE